MVENVADEGLNITESRINTSDVEEKEEQSTHAAHVFFPCGDSWESNESQSN
jgi:hypothetical protein